MTQPPEIRYGQLHNTILNKAGDAEHSIDIMPGLMRVMLEEGGWKKFQRPIDKREFVNESVADWVLGSAYAGLGFPDWATVFALLKCNKEDGARCRELLIAEGAPDLPDSMLPVVDRDGRIVALPEAEKGGRGKTRVDNTGLQRGATNAPYLAARIKRDHPDVADRLERGEFKSVRAAAKAAGIVRDPTPLEQLERWWSKATPDERAAFREWIDTPVFDRSHQQ